VPAQVFHEKAAEQRPDHRGQAEGRTENALRLADMIARIDVTALARQIRVEQDSASKREQDASKALAAGQEDLAREVAERIVGHERRAEELTQTRELLQQRISGLKERVQRAEKQLADYRRELQVVKTNERVLRTTAQIDTNINSNQSSLSTAKETLERIRDRQAREEDRQNASATLEKELTGADLDEKLKAAGIDSEQDAVNDVLARLKGNQAQ